MPNTTPLDGSSIAFVGNYLPRQCGIATFTHDLCEAVAQQCTGQYDVFAVAMNDKPEGYPYPPRVRFEIRQNVQADYRLAAEFLNMNQVSAICLQHEYGIFGGTCGSHLLSMLRRIRRPLVTTCHTILKDPTEQQKLVLQEVARISDRIVVMADVAREFLHDVYSVPDEKVALIPHGIPDVPFVDPHFFKDQFGVEGKKVLLTFGLLSPGKGLEYAIEALPAVVAKHPDVVYIVLGATHPHVKAESGEEYRNSLMRRVHELGLRDNVIFVNRFVAMKELIEYLGAAEVYVTPYLNEAQITSGTLVYAMGTGKAVVSTPYWHAKEVLAEDRGILVPFHDSKAMSDGINRLLDNELELNAMRKRAYSHCRKMIWQRTAQDYLDLFQAATESWVERRHQTPTAAKPTRRREKFDLPDLDLRHLRLLTDTTGVQAHCRYTTPDRNDGYQTDDQAKALVVSAMHWDLHHDESIIPLMQTYLAFLSHAFNEETRRFEKLMSYDRVWQDSEACEETHGRVLWSLGIATALCPHTAQIALASRMFLSALPEITHFKSPRSWALTLVGIQAYLRRFGGDSEVRRHRAELAEKLFDAFQNHATDDWPWPEDMLTYANAQLPHALISCGKWMQRNDMMDCGKRALSWLLDIQTNSAGFLSTIGTEGWYKRGGTRATFDQQCIEAHALVDACIETFHCTREDYWLEQAQKAFYWFLGENDLRTPLYDFTTGGCRDGLRADSVNENQGADSTLSWLMSLLMMTDLQMELSLAEIPADKPSEKRPVRKAIAPTGPMVTARTQEDA